MTVTCPVIDVIAIGPNITATSIVPSKTSCQALCSLTVNVIWTNQGDTAGTYIPGLSINGGTPTTLPSESLDPGQSIEHIFNVSGLPQGSHIVCPVPN